MSFHFKCIRIKDWLVYGGETEIELPDFKKGRNLVVVNGQNGYGKTSLLRALSFVFDDRGNRQRQELLEAWNEKARASGEGSLELAIEFVHGGRLCKVVRGADFKPWGGKVSTTPWAKLFIDDKEVTEQVEDKIEEMLPRDCLGFVFFDGAEISRYAQKQHEAGIKEAIEKVLGIPAVRNLRHDVQRLIGELEEEQERLISASGKSEPLLAEIESLKSDEASYLSKREELSEKKSSLESTKRAIETEAEGIQAVEQERRELEEKHRRRANLRERREELDSQIRGLISETPLLLLEEPLQQVIEEYRAKQQPSLKMDRLLSQVKVLAELIEEDNCLCGREIDEDARQQLSAELKRTESLVGDSQGVSREAAEALLELSALRKSIAAKKWDPEELIDKRADVDNQLEELETDISRLRRQLEGHGLVEVKEVYEQIGQLRQQIDEVGRQIESIDKNLDRTRSLLTQKQRELDEIAAGDQQARGVTRTLEEARRIHGAVSELVDELVKRKRAAIEDLAADIFRQITNKPLEYDKISVKPDYTLEVVRKDGTVVESQSLSAGEKEVVAYSFITALNLSSRDPAPFVMDTPFGHLDSGHRAGLLRSLPKLDVQAILLATDRDLPPSERDAIDGSIAKEFTLRRDQQRAITTIEES